MGTGGRGVFYRAGQRDGCKEETEGDKKNGRGLDGVKEKER